MWSIYDGLIQTVRQRFLQLLSLIDIKPRDKADYYIIGGWMVGKRLALTVIVMVGVCSLWGVLELLPMQVQADGMMPQGVFSYQHSSPMLKNYTGLVGVAAQKGHIAFVGQLTDGLATGQGVLYDERGSVIYSGGFFANQYSGEGKLYYPNGNLRYEGAFSFNLFNGEGKLYLPDGRIEYEGEFQNGRKSGMGNLYDDAGRKIYCGRFYRDRIQFTAYLEKSVSALESDFWGIIHSYREGEALCMSYPRLGAIYAAETNQALPNGEAIVKRVYLSGTENPYDGSGRQTGADLNAQMGKPLYEGSSPMTFYELVVISELRREGADVFSRIELSALGEEDMPYAEIYIRSYQQNRLIYTFYFEDKSEPYIFYSIEAVS